MVKRFIKDEKGFHELEEDEDEEEKKEKESELEDELEEKIPESLDTGQLKEFLSKGSPVLKEVAKSGQQIITLERGVANTPIRNADNGEEEFKYAPGQPQDNEPKYIESDSHITADAERIDETKIGKRGEWERHRNQSAFFRQSESWMGNNNSNNIEKYTAPERFDVESAGRRDPFKREEKKYNPKLPKH